MTKKKTRATPRHAFKFKVQADEDEKPHIQTVWAKVIKARKPVTLHLKAEDIRRSIKLKGIGNTQTCAMACCAKRSANSFPHPVEGYIDWQYRTAYVVSKLHKDTGMIAECVAYTHNDEIAKLNDTLGGQQRLLAQLEKYGDRVIRLRPCAIRKKPGHGPYQPQPTGKRSSRPAAVGAKLRFAMSQLDGVQTT